MSQIVPIFAISQNQIEQQKTRPILIKHLQEPMPGKIMAKKTYTKTMLNVGTYISPDGTVEVTPDRLRKWAENHKSLRDAGYSVPMQWDHADTPEDAMPMSSDDFRSSRSSRNTVGHLKDIEVAEDGSAATVVMEIHDEGAQKKADDNTVFVSPVIFDQFVDGHGTEYEDIITHLDIVNYPVDHSQGSFEPAETEPGAVMCGIRMGLGFGTPGTDEWEPTQPGFLRLGSKRPWDDEDEDEDEYEDAEYDDDDYDDDDDEDDVDVDVEVDTSDDDEEYDYADDVGGDHETPKDDDSGDPKEYDYDDTDDYSADVDEDSLMEEAMEAERAAKEQAAAAAREAMDKEAIAARAVEDLRSAGIAPPEGVDPLTDPVGFLSQLCASLRQKKMDEADEEDSYGDMDMKMDDSEEVTVKSPEYAQMSARLERAEATQKALRKAHIETAKKTRRMSLDSLLKTGRITAKEHEEACESLGKVRMSLDAEGNVEKTDVDHFISARQGIPAGSVWPSDERAERLSLEVEGQPSDFMQDVKPEEAKAYVDAQESRNAGMFQN